MKHGQGVYTYKNKDEYTGLFHNDRKNDENCTLIFKKSQSKYTGGIKDGKYHGRGRLEQSDEQYYEGYYLDGKKSGKGTLRGVDYTYEGDFYEDMKHGRGIIKFDSGQSF